MRVMRHAYAVAGWGVGELWEADGRVVVANDAPTERGIAPGSGRTGGGFVPELLERFDSFYRGDRVDFVDVELDLEWCTPFQAAVADTLRTVPWGEVVSYSELALLAGYPRAQRAVGTFCAGNRHSLLLPCHRVVGAQGIGSYGSLGVAYKRRLLRLESHVL